MNEVTFLRRSTAELQSSSRWRQYNDVYVYVIYYVSHKVCRYVCTWFVVIGFIYNIIWRTISENESICIDAPIRRLDANINAVLCAYIHIIIIVYTDTRAPYHYALNTSKSYNCFWRWLYSYYYIHNNMYAQMTRSRRRKSLSADVSSVRKH